MEGIGSKQVAVEMMRFQGEVIRFKRFEGEVIGFKQWRIKRGSKNLNEEKICDSKIQKKKDTIRRIWVLENTD